MTAAALILAVGSASRMGRGDTPVPKGGGSAILSRIIAADRRGTPGCSASSGSSHILVGSWPAAGRDALGGLLSEPGQRAVAWFTEAIGMRRVDFPAGKWDPFLNVNAADDLAIARSRAPRREEGQP